jgi:hypothetical protein
MTIFPEKGLMTRAMTRSLNVFRRIVAESEAEAEAEAEAEDLKRLP